MLLAPGVTNNGPGGNDRLPVIEIAGAPSYENLFLLNGVVLNENLRGQAFDLFIEDAVQETTASAGVSAEYGRFSGGVSTCSRSPAATGCRAPFRTSFNKQKWKSKVPLGSRTSPRTDKTIPVYEATYLGGPIWVDRIWGFAYRTQRRRFPADESEHGPGRSTPPSPTRTSATSSASRAS